MEHRYDNLIAAESSAALQYNRENDMLAKKTIVVLGVCDNIIKYCVILDYRYLVGSDDGLVCVWR